MCNLLGPVLIIGNFFSIILMSMHHPAKFQQYGVIFAKNAANAKIRLFFCYRVLFLGGDTVPTYSTV